ncbi:methylated-DNA--[protein]-cysteine S-methyltransferase [Frigoriglobus tundricola]|uniref:Methylated-DNA--protein-cysteine methyltransferase n=1 Tax=Frigoriglobus tundricola TaxID=2774151 RepID=A0A6M5YKY0_9BACT|nr:methylated-DNA--[protein]-cysteine S-methyltransferase [Frigoriglobus tundricola]QJW93943.1 Methylated-DNA--protein-cysteine methyltransferase [Frigoriglobus tundricola]
MSYVHKSMKSPIGELTLVGSDRGLVAVLWEDEDPRRVPIPTGPEDANHPVLLETERQLGQYFAGTRKEFTVPLDFVVGTPFQQRVWRALLDIPFGETRSYADLARQLGRPKAVRAVGAANGKNPIAIIGPCHRVIGTSGKLTGYAGGLAAKALLLRLEGVAGDALNTRYVA